MYIYLYSCSKNRIIWLLLALTAFILEVVGFYLQYVMLINPCVLCIYQRLTLYCIMIAGILVAISPSIFLLRFIGISVLIYSAWKGLRVSIIQYKTNISPFFICDLVINFPSWLHYLDKFFPYLFYNTSNSNCAVNKLNLISLSMTKWMMFIFSGYIIIGIVILLAQFCTLNKKIIFNKRN
ncbi:disulfide bond formation protein DsbB [Candidatus Palibaumannia cicadellinicola]|uniref:Periplasmic thiol:disulfide oxidoreductase, required for DsbA reoxidation n=1 Tax=Candidatus Palibaumannia cicadellinicola TaxID=186490 RepID=A0A0K2BLB3_9GAMM|nr:disulfide bond formation protein DsbB [Candidatus Baumannia cicadellinicola]AKZ65984.1 Periplasmic thiol:disulfide oxidoreductase, required for DsbA reoxidation [Candidatus Baumannia cicadellinicola]